MLETELHGSVKKDVVQEQIGKTEWKIFGLQQIVIIIDLILMLLELEKKVIAPYRIDGKPKDWVEAENGNYRDTCPSNFWDDITVPFWSMSENTAHPTQKPEKLIAKIMLASSSVGDVVLDPFLGSGTTSVVAKKLKRHYVGIEIQAQYCVWAEQRLEMAESNPDIQGYVDGVFWERNSLPKRFDCKIL